MGEPVIEARIVALDRALEAVGGVNELARRLGINSGAVSQWRRREGVPLGRVAAVAAITGVPVEELRPDALYVEQMGTIEKASRGPRRQARATRPFVTHVFPQGSRALDTKLIAEAEAVGLDVEAVLANALKKALSDQRAEAWWRENRAAVRAQERWLEENGPLLPEFGNLP